MRTETGINEPSKAGSPDDANAGHSTIVKATERSRVCSGDVTGEPCILNPADEARQADVQKTIPGTEESASSEEPATNLIGRIVGKFRLEEEIDRGGMGLIFRSKDLVLDREVAVKLLKESHVGKPLLHQQFMNEVRITARLQHPGIIPIYETGAIEDDRPYFAMKLVRGYTLAELLAKRKSPDQDLPRFLKVFEQVCQTLSYTHSSGIIHLDIKPANIMVGAFGDVHVMDWGLAKMLSEPATAAAICTGAGEIVERIDFDCDGQHVLAEDVNEEPPIGAVWGTPAYMSPEQARGADMDVRSDVFLLGGLLSEILTGRPPYVGRNMYDVCFKAAKADLSQTLSLLAKSDIDDVLLRLAIKCLSPDPADRPEDAITVAKVLTLYLESFLTRSANDLERFFELSLDLFCIAGLDGFFRRVNSNFPRVLGFSEKELLSRPFLEFVHADDRADTLRVMSKLSFGQPVVQFRNRYQTHDGQWRCFEWTAKSIPEDDIIFAVARDVTDHGPGSEPS